MSAARTAGLTAALYAAREGSDTQVIERAGIGGQAGITERLDTTFRDIPEGVSGSEFADRLRHQSERFGVEILSAQEVTAVALGIRRYLERRTSGMAVNDQMVVAEPVAIKQ